MEKQGAKFVESFGGGISTDLVGRLDCDGNPSAELYAIARVANMDKTVVTEALRSGTELGSVARPEFLSAEVESAAREWLRRQLQAKLALYPADGQSDRTPSSNERLCRSLCEMEKSMLSKAISLLAS